MSDEEQVVIVKEETLRVKHAKWALTLSIAVVSVVGICGMAVLMWAFFKGGEAPAWATSAETAVLTAALALIFRDRSEASK